MACLRAGVFPDLQSRATASANGVKRPDLNGRVFLKGKSSINQAALVRRSEFRTMALSMDNGSKVITGAGGAILEDVPHLTDWLPDLPVSS